jgi:hypothetical protein
MNGRKREEEGTSIESGNNGEPFEWELENSQHQNALEQRKKGECTFVVRDARLRFTSSLQLFRFRSERI